jgi:CMP-N-acetylneuraminic acid synthetase
VRVLGIVPSKARSRRLPGKNLMRLGGKALWEIAVGQGLDAGCEVVVVPTDSPEILALPEPRRTYLDEMPERYGLDDNRVEWTVEYVLEKYQALLGPFDVLVMLNPTHPLRQVQDIRACIELCGIYPSCTGVRRDFTYTVPEGARLDGMNEQDRIPRMVVTGGIYAVTVPAFMEQKKLMLYGNVTKGTWHEQRGAHVDIDRPEDFVVARALFGEAN